MQQWTSNFLLQWQPLPEAVLPLLEIQNHRKYNRFVRSRCLRLPRDFLTYWCSAWSDKDELYFIRANNRGTGLDQAKNYDIDIEVAIPTTGSSPPSSPTRNTPNSSKINWRNCCIPNLLLLGLMVTEGAILLIGTDKKQATNE
jgi:hypothetical protein